MRYGGQYDAQISFSVFGCGWSAILRDLLRLSALVARMCSFAAVIENSNDRRCGVVGKEDRGLMIEWRRVTGVTLMARGR